MKFVTHNDEYVNNNMTSLVGYIDANYAELCSLFGQPEEEVCDKVDWEWIIRFNDGTIVTIYNWKNGPGYGYYSTRAVNINHWHVGGHDARALELIHKVIWDNRQKKHFPDLTPAA